MSVFLLLTTLMGVSAAVGLERGEFNCFTKEMWSEEKSEWCCKARGVGCHTVKADCDSISSQKECDASGCSWCKAGAVPDSCKTLDEAKALPASVFDCDNIVH